MKINLLIVIGWLGSVMLCQSPFLFGQSRSVCLVCHSDQSITKEKDGKQTSLFVDEAILNKSPHKKLLCTACHAGFNPDDIPHKESIQPINCMNCHKDAPVRHPFHPQMMKSNVTNGKLDVSCKYCHGTHDVISPKVPGSKFSSSRLTESCGQCHTAVRDKFISSAHAKALKLEISGAPSCLTCHRIGISSISAGKDSAQLKIAQEKMCLSCHLDDPSVRERTVPAAGFIAAYEKSVHGTALLKGNAKAANCIDCHGSHEMKRSYDPTALVNKAHIAEQCGHCHESIAHEFNRSVHGVSVLKGNKDAPACTDCHGEHNILSHDNPRSPVAPLNVSGQVCSPCHSSLKLSQKYGISADRYQTFSDSYHGLAIRAGSIEVANCASCHGVHNIKPSADTTSTVHKANLAKKCGTCHPGANERFTIGAVHVVITASEEPILYWIATLYIILIVSIVGGMFLHNVLDFLKKAKRKLSIRRGTREHHIPKHRLYVRMTLSERLQHGTLLISFTILVITGFMLRYPEAWWVVSIRNLSDHIFDLRSLLHRVSGVVMIAASLFHLWYILFTQRGQQLMRDLLPKIQDVYDAIGVLKYNLGLSRNKPQFGRFSYIEKSEYWALVWGTVVMAATGLIMWFDNAFMGLLTKLGWDIARTIHFYEAWLATLSILIWHLYFVIFNPAVYPMNLAWLKGTLSEEEMEEEHPLELEAIEQAEIDGQRVEVDEHTEIKERIS